MTGQSDGFHWPMTFFWSRGWHAKRVRSGKTFENMRITIRSQFEKDDLQDHSQFFSRSKWFRSVFVHVFSCHNGKENANHLISQQICFEKMFQPSLLAPVPRISGESWALWPLIPAFQQLAMRLRLDGRFEAAWWIMVKLLELRTTELWKNMEKVPKSCYLAARKSFSHMMYVWLEVFSIMMKTILYEDPIMILLLHSCYYWLYWLRLSGISDVIKLLLRRNVNRNEPALFSAKATSFSCKVCLLWCPAYTGSSLFEMYFLWVLWTKQNITNPKISNWRRWGWEFQESLEIFRRADAVVRHSLLQKRTAIQGRFKRGFWENGF